MKNGKEKFKTELKKRMYVWTVSLVKTTDTLPKSRSTDIIAQQLLRSGTSVCANYVEAQAASSKKDFVNYIHISLKSANETKYWLALLRDLKKLDETKVDSLTSELIEISNILGASLITLKNRR